LLFFWPGYNKFLLYPRQPARFHHPDGGLDAACAVHFLQEMADVLRHRVDADAQRIGDLLIARALGQVAQHFMVPLL
jgi:hypothetical protein